MRFADKKKGGYINKIRLDNIRTVIDRLFKVRLEKALARHILKSIKTCTLKTFRGEVRITRRKKTHNK